MGEGTKPGNIYALILTYLLWKEIPYRKFEEFYGIKVGDILRRIEGNKVPTKSIEHSIPDWLVSRMMAELGDEWETEITALNRQAPTVLRANRLKTTPEELIELFQEQEIYSHPLAEFPDAVELEKKTNVFLTAEFKNGFFEVQDASSQRIADFLNLKPGQRVIDACAGAGGKTLHLADRMQNKGQIIALDIHAWKLAELKRRAKRAGAHNIEARLIEDTKVIKRLYNSADRVLIDAPCSGLGVLKRNPDSKWKIDEDFLQRIRIQQQEILSEYAKFTKVGGKVLYATCSILPSENQDQVETFLKANPSFKLIKHTTLWPSQGYDGFYMALLERNA